MSRNFIHYGFNGTINPSKSKIHVSSNLLCCLSIYFWRVSLSFEDIVHRVVCPFSHTMDLHGYTHQSHQQPEGYVHLLMDKRLAN